MGGEPDYYSVLGVDPQSENVVIQAAYRALMRKYHPDANSSEDSARKCAELNAAYEVIGRADRRAAYDARQANARKDATSSKPSTTTAQAKGPPSQPVNRKRQEQPFKPPQPTPAQTREANVLIGFSVLFLVLILGSLVFFQPYGGSGATTQAPAEGPATKQAADGMAAAADQSQEPPGPVANPNDVTKASFEKAGKTWPLTADHGTVGCTGNAAWIEVDGRRYGLNGFATEANGFADIKPIWAEDDTMNKQLAAAGAGGGPPLRINIGDLIDEALKHCS